MLTAFRPALLVAAPLLMLSACEKPAQLNVVDVTIQLSPVTDRPSAGYATVNGGPQDVKLLSVDATNALKVEMHDMKMDGGVMKMEPIFQVRVPAKSEVKFAPGGKHLMLWGIDETSRKKGSMDLQFVFSNGDRILATAKIEKMGDNAK